MPRTRILWITPLRALANDTARALHEAISALQEFLDGGDAHR